MHATRLSDRRYWPAAQDAWLGGYAAIAPEHLTDRVHREEWRQSMRRLAKRHGTSISLHSDRPRMVAVANDGYPLDIRTASQREQWDQLASSADGTS